MTTLPAVEHNSVNHSLIQIWTENIISMLSEMHQLDLLKNLLNFVLFCVVVCLAPASCIFGKTNTRFSVASKRYRSMVSISDLGLDIKLFANCS